MKKEELNKLDIVKEYLLLSTIYGYLLLDYRKKMEQGVFCNIKYSPHGSGMHVIDENKGIEIDFDYIKYNGKNIEYFDIWKLNLFSEKKYGITIGQLDIDYLENKGNIKKDTGSYYKII